MVVVQGEGDYPEEFNEEFDEEQAQEDLKKKEANEREMLPNDQEPVRVEYHYPNGDVFYIEGENLQAYRDNITSSSIHYVIHGQEFKELKWTKK